MTSLSHHDGATCLNSVNTHIYWIAVTYSFNRRLTHGDGVILGDIGRRRANRSTAATSSATSLASGDYKSKPAAARILLEIPCASNWVTAPSRTHENSNPRGYPIALPCRFEFTSSAPRREPGASPLIQGRTLATEATVGQEMFVRACQGDSLGICP